ncbi:MAG: hypothetical protein KKH93_04605 [Candidatus Omnitrophica bacterium]|nr:hypothetical protein [Candidatus Omnitrophota bacterium]MBU2044456.1 hypothetical protein [Candidatus Omnitrophota bacterium]MBU2251590.1 hypothetical protein [Candidatus Omnitrophota bacterium]MBU2265965.1 hypothetical protein [Candidatus Omnitrophota bacterium]MBU2474086.1 hypothetical protein [Candidatus Omnitrophota bacterium]
MKNYWNIAITCSLLFHGAFFLKLPAFSNFFARKKTVLKKTAEKEIVMIAEEIKAEIENKSGPISLIKPFPYTENIINTLIKNPGSGPIDKPKVFERNVSEIILSEIPPHDKELNKNPAYMNYYRLIREKIRSNTYRYYRAPDTGKILLSFIVLSSGGLGGLSFEEESENSNVLRQIAIDSLEAAAPFPPFPVELQSYTRLSFRIPIYFRNN